MPRSSASCVVSLMVTGMPTLTKLIAMPPPMVPAPITAAFLMARAGVSSGTSGIFEVWRSAKKAWRSAFASFVVTACSKRPRAARAGQDAELHLRQAKLRFRRGDAVVAGERELQAAAEREAADRGDQRLLQRILRVVDNRQVGLLARFAELADVGAAREALSGADQHHGLHLRLGRRALETLQDAGAQRIAKAVHRRIVQCDDGYAV